MKVFPQQLERLLCWYYRQEGLKKYTTELESVAIVQIPSFIQIGSGIQKLLGGYILRQQGDPISLN
jgi:hypothetical protein